MRVRKKAYKVILNILAKMRKPIHSTALVKLVYLVDYLHAQHTGETITGYQYEWDNYGPNALSHAIIRDAHHLAERGVLRCFQAPTIYGTEATKFQSLDEVSIPSLAPLEEAIIFDVLARYGRLGLQQLVAESKRTAPFKTAKQYDRLELKKTKEVLHATDDDIKRYKQELQRFGTQSLEEVKIALGLS